MTMYRDECCHLTQDINSKQSLSPTKCDSFRQVAKVCDQLKRHGVHSSNRLKTAGFIYTGESDTTRCNTCGLEVSGWIREMDPFSVHLERNPNCSFVRSLQLKNNLIVNDVENPPKRQKTELYTDRCNQQNKLIELEILKEVRRRTFSHWSHQTTPTKEQMITAGFFQCNVGDRVICLYCNLICQQWQVDIDDPSEVHKTLSPKCSYVLSNLTQEQVSSVLIVNDISTNNNSNQAALFNNVNRLRFDQIVYTSPCHIGYTSIPSRQATFETWKNKSSVCVDEFVKAGFFYTGTKNIVTCFYCNGSLQNWNEKDNPLIEHTRWFPHCPYAKQLCGNDLYNKVQEAKRIRQERDKTKGSTNTNTTDDSSTSNNHRLLITDERGLSRLVAARLDLPISQSLLGKNFKLSIIKRCWEDQLQLKQDDFVSDCDLLVACIILQKQIEHINGNKDNIIVPSIKMKSIRDRKQSDTLAEEQVISSSSSSSLPTSLSTDPSNDSIIKASDVLVQASSSVESMTVETTIEQRKEEETTKLPVSNPCVLCWKEEKRLACIPCGHLATCINCSQILHTCPICRRGIEAFVRIYI